jgi:hypothetical protein
MSDTQKLEQLSLPLGSDDLSVVCDADADPKNTVSNMGSGSEWTQKRLREVCRAVGGGTPSRTQPKFWNGEIPWASVKDFKDDAVFLLDTEEHITREGVASSATTLVPENTPVVCTRMAVGRCALTTRPTAINQDLKALLLNLATRDWHTRIVTLNPSASLRINSVKGLAVRSFAALLMNKSVVRTAHATSVSTLKLCIALRPFDSADATLRVNGQGKS